MGENSPSPIHPASLPLSTQSPVYRSLEPYLSLLTHLSNHLTIFYHQDASQESYWRRSRRQRTEPEEDCRRPGSCFIQRYDQGRYHQPQGTQWKQPTSNQKICQGKQQRHHHIRDSIRLSFQQGLEVWCREG